MRKISLTPISKENTLILKGIAILLIVLHNYYKWVNPVTGENEFGFSLSHSIKSFIYVRSNPMEIINVFFNFFGHYGVQAFIFLSAYGLTKSYQISNTGYGKFLLHRLNRIYPSLLLASFVYIIFYIIRHNGQFISSDVLTDLGIQLSLLANFFPGKAIAITGPWWFYSMIFQFYLLFPFFMWINKRFGIRGLIVLTIIGYAFIIFLYDPIDKLSLNTQLFMPGHLPVFCFGILLASRESIKIPVWVLPLALVIFIGGNLSEWLWPFSFLAVTLLILISVRPLFKLRKGNNHRFFILSFFGSVSMYLFACHGFLRRDFLALANHLTLPLTSLLVGLMFLLFSTAIALLMKQTEQLVREWLAKPKNKSYSYLWTIFLIGLIGSGIFGLSYWNSRVENSVQEHLNPLYTLYNDFEKINIQKSGRFSDTICYSGKFSYYMPSQPSFSPPLLVDLDTIDTHNLREVVINTMIYTEDSLAEGHIVFEIYDKPTNYRMEWVASTFSLSSDTTWEMRWIEHSFNYEMPHYFLKHNYQIKAYLWNNSRGDFYVDNLVLTLLGKQN